MKSLQDSLPVRRAEGGRQAETSLLEAAQTALVGSTASFFLSPFLTASFLLSILPIFRPSLGAKIDIFFPGQGASKEKADLVSAQIQLEKGRARESLIQRNWIRAGGGQTPRKMCLSPAGPSESLLAPLQRAHEAIGPQRVMCGLNHIGAGGGP